MYSREVDLSSFLNLSKENQQDFVKVVAIYI